MIPTVNSLHLENSATSRTASAELLSIERSIAASERRERTNANLAMYIILYFIQIVYISQYLHIDKA